jgi:hypothetical protein
MPLPPGPSLDQFSSGSEVSVRALYRAAAAGRADYRFIYRLSGFIRPDESGSKSPHPAHAVDIEPVDPPYEPGTWDAALVDKIRRLYEENPKRSVTWLGKRTGQPRSVVQAVLDARGEAG